METRFVFCYQMIDDAARIGEAVPGHIAYWEGAALDRYLGGPFTDRSGGLITFAATDLEHAERVVRQDPFVRESLVRDWWIKEWLARGGDGA